MVDPVGMVTPGAHKWSVFSYLRVDGQLYAPPTISAHQRLDSDVLPCVITEYPCHEGIHWTSASEVTRLAGVACAVVTVSIRNRSAETVSLRAGLALRPYNPLALGHVHELSVGPASTLWANRCVAVVSLRAPTKVFMGDRGLGDPLLQPHEEHERERILARSGVAAACLDYHIELAPLGESELLFAIPLRPPTRDDWICGCRAELHEHRWHKLKNPVDLPPLLLSSALLQRQFHAIRNRWEAFDDGTHYSPGTFLYHTHWFRDAFFMSEAARKMGLVEGAVQKVLRYRDAQRRNGFFRSHPTEWDSNGQAMVAIERTLRTGGCERFLEEQFPILVKGAEWIQKMRVRAPGTLHHGLLPRGFSAEHFGGNEYYFWDNFWSIAALRTAANLAAHLGRRREMQTLEEWQHDYSGSLRRSIAGTLERVESNVLPVSPYRWPDAASVGNLVALNPLGLGDLCEEWIDDTVQFLLSQHFFSGMFYQSIFHTGLNPYLTAQVARVLLSRGDSRFFAVLESISRKASATVTWPEAINPRTGGGCMGDGDHGWSAAEFCNLVLDMLVMENGSELLLGHGVPARWLEPESERNMASVATVFGTVELEIVAERASALFRWRLDAKGRSPDRIFISLPRGLFAVSGGIAVGQRILCAVPSFGVLRFMRMVEEGLL
jgi:hypothetical protein